MVNTLQICHSTTMITTFFKEYMFAYNVLLVVTIKKNKEVVYTITPVKEIRTGCISKHALVYRIVLQKSNTWYLKCRYTV